MAHFEKLSRVFQLKLPIFAVCADLSRVFRFNFLLGSPTAAAHSNKRGHDQAKRGQRKTNILRSQAITPSKSLDVGEA